MPKRVEPKPCQKKKGSKPRAKEREKRKAVPGNLSTGERGEYILREGRGYIRRSLGQES